MGNERYNRGARALHWIIALLIIANLASGFLHEPLAAHIRVMPLHKATGMTILALSLARILWRLGWKRPPHPATMPRWEVFTANGVQALFYALMIVMPVTGWIVASAGTRPLEWFGLFAIPKLAVVKHSTIYDLAHQAHGQLGWLFLALVLLHVAAALHHHYVLKDNVLKRMT